MSVIPTIQTQKPLVRLCLLTRRTFGLGTVAAVFLGFALFGSVYLPLGQVQHYNAEQIGACWPGPACRSSC